MNPESTPLLSKPILLFVNPASGGGLGLRLMELLANVNNVYIVQLPSEQNTWPEKYSNVVGNPELRAAVAGGDGSVNWVVTLLSNYYTGSFRPPLAVIPFGTGNDMSRSLGWGKGMSNSHLLQIGRLIENIESSTHIEDVDVWSVTIHDKIKNETKTSQMINYLSFGTDAAIAVDYEGIRRSCQPFLCCQCMSQSLFVPAGILNMCGKRDLNEYMSVDLVGLDGWNEDVPQRMKNSNGDKTLIFMSSKTIYGGKSIWKGQSPQMMNDGKFEVISNGGLIKVSLVNINVNLSHSYGQASAARIETFEPCFYQIDGEGSSMNNPAIFDLVHMGTYPLLFNMK
ncbi:diacylglycerol kinase 2 isoform X1 [Histomonas meleagridis]|uniref:diacylglycerol kinase 2 isoform X1 n=1 Tax=Histomonas meleagridis TaxID=135588 RepID=UPI00355A7268|nr:diacylglycerol kinase 2 isoform X1 [Histomonas meleagridis]KAH0802494.1 diacylglycerol kinase 2 isoform X1 [Histomonas meleagridis]